MASDFSKPPFDLSLGASWLCLPSPPKRRLRPFSRRQTAKLSGRNVWKWNKKKKKGGTDETKQKWSRQNLRKLLCPRSPRQTQTKWRMQTHLQSPCSDTALRKHNTGAESTCFTFWASECRYQWQAATHKHTSAVCLYWCKALGASSTPNLSGNDRPSHQNFWDQDRFLISSRVRNSKKHSKLLLPVPTEED